MRLVPLLLLTISSTCSTISVVEGANNSSESRNIWNVKQFVDLLKDKFDHHELSTEKDNSLSKISPEIGFLILDQLSLPELVQAAQINRLFSFLAADIYQRRYSNRTIKIYRLDSRPSVFDNLIRNYIDHDWRKDYATKFNINSESIDLYEYEFTLDFLKSFGSMIRTIGIFIFEEKYEKKMNNVNQFINKYCSKTLTHLSYRYTMEKTFEQFTKPFYALEKLAVVFTSERVSSNTRPMDEVFPNVRNMFLRFEFGANHTFIQKHFPHLEELDVMDSNSNYDNDVEIKKILQKNPNIRKLHINIFATNMVKELSQLLPQLEELKIFYIGSDDAHFEHLKVFDILLPPRSLTQITCPNLEELRMIYSSSSRGMWTDFLRKYRNISRLHIKDEVDVWESDLSTAFETITADLHDLVEFSINSQTIFVSDVLTRFISQHNKLNIFEFSPCTENNLEILRNVFEDSWMMTRSQKNGKDYLKLQKIPQSTQ